MSAHLGGRQLARQSNRQRLIEGSYDPLDTIKCAFPISVSGPLHLMAEERGVKVQVLVREAVKKWLAEQEAGA